MLRKNDFVASKGCVHAKKLAESEVKLTQDLSEVSLETNEVRKLIRLWFLNRYTIDASTQQLEKDVCADIAGQTNAVIDKTEEGIGKKIARKIFRLSKTDFFTSLKDAAEKDENMAAVAPHLELDGNFIPKLAEAYPDLAFEGFSDDSLDLLVDGLETDEESGLKTLDGVIIKAGKTYLSNSANSNHPIYRDLPSLMILQAMKSRVPEGEGRHIRLFYVYAEQPNDKSGEKWWFNGKISTTVAENDFVNTEQGRSILSPVDSQTISLLEEHYAGHECNIEECAHCENNFECNFKPAPEAQEEREQKMGKAVTLSEVQAQVRDWRKGVLRVVAGAGSGKTEVGAEHITSIIKEEISNGLSKKEACATFLGITFTHNGANEMKERIVGKLARDEIFVTQADISISTIHTFCLNLIRPYWKELGYKKPFGQDEDSAVINDIDQMKMIADLLNKNPVTGLRSDISEIANNWNARGQIACAKAVFDTIKNYDIDIEDSGAANKICEHLRDYLSGDNPSMLTSSVEELIDLYIEYRSRLQSLSLLEFSDMINYAAEIMEQHPEIVDELGYKHIFLDEAQDTSQDQICGIIKPLVNAKCFQEAVVVGDDFQNIYGTMLNTDPECFVRLESPKYLDCDVETVYLVDNYRSTPEILDTAGQIIADNKTQLPKKVNATRPSGKPVSVQGFYSIEDEQKYWVDTCLRLHEEGRQWSDIALLFRTNGEIDLAAAALTQAGIPVVYMNPLKYVENSRVQAALELTKGFIEPETTRKYRNYLVAKYNGKLSETLTEEEIAEEIDALQKTFESMDSLDFNYQRKIFHDLLDALSGNDEIYDGFLKMVKNHEDLPSELEFIFDFKHFGQNQTKRMSKAYEGVCLITAHSSKGMEWDVVIASVSKFDNFRLHWSSGRNNNSKELEETRRLLYVTMTRAKDELYMTSQYVAWSHKGQDGEKIDEYNQFLERLCEITGTKYCRIDPLAAQKAAEKAEANKKRTAERKARKDAEKLAKAQYLNKVLSAS